ncbi:MAG: glycosyltransferase family 4 protein [Candidatus Omnitrophica bacterium]|nr:glycosyltransferase family 4 protein [Candidatus Omnitrophota bacterium]
MNIIHELNQLNYGGVEKVIRNIIKYDKENNHQIVAYKDGPFKKEFEKIGARVVFLPKEGTVDFDADVIHVHSGGGISEMAKILGRNFPVVETIHSPVRSPMTNEFISQRVGVTEAVCRMNSNCITIYNGLDLDTLEPDRYPEDVKKELGIPDGVPIVGRLGRIGKDKCLEEWILACYYLQQQGVNFIPLIVGGEAAGLDGYVGKLKLMAASLPVKGIIWAGHRADVANYLQIMDVFLYPSPTEGFGLVFAEAMYSGSVVVTYKNDISMEVAGGYSVLTEKSIKGLVDGVKKALDINIRDNIVPMAHDFVAEMFNAERMTSEYQEVYKRVVRLR